MAREGIGVANEENPQLDSSFRPSAPSIDTDGTGSGVVRQAMKDDLALPDKPSIDTDGEGNGVVVTPAR